MRHEAHTTLDVVGPYHVRKNDRLTGGLVEVARKNVETEALTKLVDTRTI